MNFAELLALAVALSMDAFAVAVCAGCTLRALSPGHYLRLSLTFGFFQFFMPVAGWYLGVTVRPFIETWDHWVAFCLLAWIGGNMIRNALSGETQCSTQDPSRGRALCILAIATSIDALAVGFSFSMLQMTIWLPAVLIGVVCALITAAGVLMGRQLARADLFGRRVELLGGCILLLIGVKILWEHGALSSIL